MKENLLDRLSVTPEVRKRLFVASAVLGVASVFTIAGHAHAQAFHPLDNAVTVRVANKAPSIFHEKVLDPFITQGQLVQSGQGTPVPGIALPGEGAGVPGSSPSQGGIAATYILQGIINGDPSLADFQSATDPNDSEVLQVGDSLGDRKLVEIGKGYVIFNDGTRVELSDGEQDQMPGPPPAGSGALVPNIPSSISGMTPQQPGAAAVPSTQGQQRYAPGAVTTSASASSPNP